MSRYGNDEADEMRAARQRAAEAQARYDRGSSDDSRQGREVYGRDELARARSREGTWRFDQLLNSSGHPIGATATFNGSKVGILLLRGEDLMVISTSTDPGALRKAGVHHLIEDPSPAEIMAAFIRMYPSGSMPAPRVLPATNPFGPPRDWSEE